MAELLRAGFGAPFRLATCPMLQVRVKLEMKINASRCNLKSARLTRGQVHYESGSFPRQGSAGQSYLACQQSLSTLNCRYSFNSLLTHPCSLYQHPDALQQGYWTLTALASTAARMCIGSKGSIASLPSCNCNKTDALYHQFEAPTTALQIL
jgi:hypothetical protein